MERGKTRINIPRKMIVCGLDVVESGVEWRRLDELSWLGLQVRDAGHKQAPGDWAGVKHSWWK